ncbi:MULTISPECIES: peptide ABC transporter substrate-binding protein [unclassified Microbacterium]|uniref:peptide ABC transporter substrate-binding protein n=1 Tax=unclassified Microbacterium TaxID=2609290 RepID=UPI0030168552
MKRNKIALAGIGLLAAGALALAGCSSKSGGDATASTGGDSKSIIRVSGSEPENPLLPANTNEVGGGKILDSIFAGLAFYDAKGKLVNDMAESIKVDDASDLTIKVKQGNTFSNGEKVTADSFINAWQYGALFSNKQLNQSWFSDIEGFSAEADSPLTGLKKVDDYTFTIKLSNPVAADFSQRLGYSAYYPIPEAGLKDMAAFGENPIGNGPYKFAKTGAWQHKVELDLVKSDSYKGARQAKNGGVTFVFYATADAAYADLQSNKVDVIDLIPASAQQTFESDLGDRAVNQPAAIFQSFTLPGNLAHFTGDEGKLRKEAISLAIDRAAITKTIFNNTRTPASDFTSPVIAGWSDSLKGADVLKFDAKKAKELWAEADKISPWSGKFQIAYNSDSSHQAWVDAVSNQLKNNLGIDASGNPYVDFASLRKDVNARTIQTAFRTGWQADYPAQYNFLQPLYGTKASSNDSDYSNPEFDALLAKGASASDQSEATKDYSQAQEILLQDLPAIPLWYSNVNGGFAKGVNNVQFGWNSVPLYYEITKG